MKKRELKYLINTALLFALALSYFVVRAMPQQKNASTDSTGAFYVSRVIDGDTIKLSDGSHVRLIGIDTPESGYNAKLARDVKRGHKDIDAILKMGKEASNFTRGLVQGKKVRLEFDVEKRDKYGRLLAYVYLDDETFLNAKIIEEGYAQVMTIPPNVKHADLFLKMQREAREKGRGLWKEGEDKELF